MPTNKAARHVIGPIVALSLASSVAAITSSSVMNPVQTEVQVPLWYAAWMACLMAVITVVGKLAQAALDGKIEAHEIDEIFGVKEETRNAINEKKGLTVDPVEPQPE